MNITQGSRDINDGFSQTKTFKNSLDALNGRKKAACQSNGAFKGIVMMYQMSQIVYSSRDSLSCQDFNRFHLYFVPLVTYKNGRLCIAHFQIKPCLYLFFFVLRDQGLVISETISDLGKRDKQLFQQGC